MFVQLIVGLVMCASCVRSEERNDVTVIKPFSVPASRGLGEVPIQFIPPSSSTDSSSTGSPNTQVVPSIPIDYDSLATRVSNATRSPKSNFNLGSPSKVAGEKREELFNTITYVDSVEGSGTPGALPSEPKNN